MNSPLDAINKLLQCPFHHQFLKFEANGQLYCIECCKPSRPHAIFTQMASLFPVDMDFLEVDSTTRNDMLLEDKYDFSSTELRTIDTLLRCPVSKGLYDTPMLLTCGHHVDKFSLKLLHGYLRCPSCDAPLNELHMVTDGTLLSVCHHWAEFRHELLHLEAIALNMSPLVIPTSKYTLYHERIAPLIGTRHTKPRLTLSEVTSKLEYYGLPSNGTKRAKVNRYHAFLDLVNRQHGKNRPLSPNSILMEMHNRVSTNERSLIQECQSHYNSALAQYPHDTSWAIHRNSDISSRESKTE